MEPFLETHGNTILLGAVICLFLVAMFWELLAPRRPESRSLLYRWTNNFSLMAISQVTNQWTSAVLSIGATMWAVESGRGLLQHYDLGLPGSFLVTLLVMEFTGYAFHVLFHKVPLFWRVHAMHHSDTQVDVSTTYRHHPFEGMFVIVTSVPLAAGLGAPVAAMVLYQLLRMSMNILSHSNIRIPESIERWLRYVIVTPDFHHLHHSSDQRFTDSNYSAAVPWFDYLFGTATRKPYPGVRNHGTGPGAVSRPHRFASRPGTVDAFQRSTLQGLTGLRVVHWNGRTSHEIGRAPTRRFTTPETRPLSRSWLPAKSIVESRE